MRDAAKEAFITKYVGITSRVAAEFPRDSAMQDLFFDEARTRSALAQADEEDGAEALGEESSGESASG